MKANARLSGRSSLHPFRRALRLWSSVPALAAIGFFLGSSPLGAQTGIEAVFAGPLDATDRKGDRQRLGVFAAFVERNAGKVVRIAIQLRAPVDRPVSVFSSWARLDWRLTSGRILSGPISEGKPLARAVELVLAFCACDEKSEAPYLFEFRLAAARGAERPQISWRDGRLLVGGRFRVEGPTRTAPLRHFILKPAPKVPKDR